jgi:hypothetical protein
MIEDSLISIRDYMSAIDMYFDVRETDYKNPHLRGDGDSLIWHLKEARAYQHNRIMGRVDPIKDGLI